LGSTGLIGSALRKRISDKVSLVTPRWSDDPALPESLAASLIAGGRVDIILACGITDPKAPESALRYSNEAFPQRLITACLALPHVRFVTLGTVMEHFPEACAANPYLKSKLDLGLWINSLSAQPEYAGRFRHVRLHTVYGGERRLVKPHMFLGQMLVALEHNSEFKMSSGDQLREYHHVEDIADCLLHLVEQNWDFSGTSFLGMHSGNPVRLADLAKAIFQAFGKESLLCLGCIARAPGENVRQTFQRSPPNVLVAARDPIVGVVQWLKEILETGPH